MKRILSAMIVIAILVCIQCVGYSEDNTVEIVLDGEVLEMVPQAKIVQGSTYVPLTPFSNGFKAEVETNKNGTKNEYKITREELSRVLEIREENGTIYEVAVNGVIKITNVKAFYDQDEIWVPLVFLVEHLGGDYAWNEESRRVIVDSFKPIIFADKNLEAAVRTSIGVPKDNIFKADLELVQTLVVSDKKIQDIDGIQYLTNLTYLDLSKNQIKDITPLRHLKKLTALLLKENQVYDYSPLAAVYDQLKVRDFSMRVSIYDKKLETAIRNKIGKLSGEMTFEDLKSITELNLDGVGISDLQGIQYLVNLETLILSNNSIKIIEPVKNLIELKKLTLNANQVVNIKPLRYLKNLEVLDLLDNNVSDISPLAELVKLKQLSLMNNMVEDISALEGIVNLEILVLRNNKVADISCLEKLINLHHLYLKGNPITDYSPIDVLRKKNPEIKIDIDTTSEFTPTPVQKPSPTPIDLNKEIVQRYYIDKPVYFVNDQKNEMDTSPLIKNGRTFLPIRYVAESLGATVLWNGEERKITVILGEKRVEMLLDNDLALVNGEVEQLDVAPFVESGRTVVPVRFVSQSLGCKVDWHQELREVIIYNEAYVKNHGE